jgi:hypothetical protein
MRLKCPACGFVEEDGFDIHFCRQVREDGNHCGTMMFRIDDKAPVGKAGKEVDNGNQ